ncbi:AP2 domain-containing protein [Megamonas hypermegale]|uniref:AP2 domain-containing protein n=1 Tax=Megamonas hypermegale TaxID=158847 RepID=UPI0026E9428D|nr:AP2 domain-containing protein [Megamonas hypermegale]
MPKAIDLTGQKFNNLTVIQELGDGRILCRCDCGNIKEYDKYKVKTGHTKSCGCKRIPEENSGRFKRIDYTGKTFNSLTIFKELGHNEVLCKCLECNSIKKFRKDRVVNGVIKNCGCIPKEKPNSVNLVGKTFGRLKVIKKIQNNPVKWLCKCTVCGHVTTVLTSNLIRHKGIACFPCSKKNTAKIMRIKKKKFNIDGTNITVIKDRKINSNNKSGFSGVFFRPKLNKWEAKIGIKNTLISLGKFDTKEEAVNARKEAEEKYFNPVVEKFEDAATRKKRGKKPVDIVGKKFSMLTVLDDLGNGKVLCRCDCGNVEEFSKTNIINGHTKSCGCLRGSTAKERNLKDLTGQKFNMLTILKELGHNKVLCRCDCGNIKEVTKSQVIRGMTKSCGCLQKTALEKNREKARFVLRDYHNCTGEKFNMLTVLNDLENGWLLCRCDCGNIKEIRKQSVINGITKSCGCLRVESGYEKAKKMNEATKKDYVGQKFNMLTIIEDLGHNKVICRCDCGNTIETYKSNVVGGRTKSCGCLKKGRKKKEQE